MAFSTQAAEYVVSTNSALPNVAAASEEGERAIKRFRVPKGLKVELFAAEPLLANPVAFCIDEKGRFFVAETFRLHSGVTDIRGHMNWLDEELASQSVEERVNYMKKHEAARIAEYTRETDRVRLVWDSNGDGKADRSTVFADGFNGIAEGIGAGLLARRGSVYYTDIPNLWLLRDEDRNGVADTKRSLLYGFGVRVGFLGHDLHGLRIGPDGKLYFTIGDRGAHVVVEEDKVQRTIANHEEGVVYRCDLDGSHLEIFARGLRNPQELAFDELGNLWTGDNNSDGGDPARWVYVVDGGDSGWRVGFQFLNSPSRGVWLTERMCYPQWQGQAAFMVPPIANIGNGPSGLTYYPGIGLAPRYHNHFFLADFRGTTGSGVHSFTVRPKGASFEVADRHEFAWETLVTDCEFGYDGSFYWSDWVAGWNKTGKGRIYRMYDPDHVKDRAITEMKKLFERGIEKLPASSLAGLLDHPDMRVRQEAQFSIVDQGPVFAATTFTRVLRSNPNLLPRVHAIWGLGQVATRSSMAVTMLNSLLSNMEPEIRAQAAKVLGENRAGDLNELVRLLVDESPRVRFFAAVALGKMGSIDGLQPAIEMLRANDDKDVYLRHAGVMALTGILRSTNGEPPTLATKKFKTIEDAATDKSDAVRMGVLLALRRLESPSIAQFLKDENPRLVAEAARAINDLPITNALPKLAALIADADKLAAFPAGDAEHPGARDSVLRRVVNANFRVGESNNAVALAAFADTSKASVALRAEAVTLLGDWANPSDRDRITGLWRPLAPRNPEIAAAALKPHLTALQMSASNPIKLAATKVAGKLNITGTALSSLDFVRDVNAPSNVRVEALRSLAAQKDPKLEEAVKLALNDRDEGLRKEATRIQAQLQPADALAQLRTTLEQGSIGEKQNAFATLGTLANRAADELIAAWLSKLAGGQVAPELQLDILDAASKRTNRTVQAKVRAFEDARPAADDLRSYRECLVGGDAEEGRKIFFERPEASCVRCHKINGEGGEVGPELAGVGARKNREYILESIVYPNKQIAQGFESAIVTLKNGTSYAGQVKVDSAETLEINSPEDGLLRVRKAEIKMRERGLSGMPEELRQVLTKHDLRDLVEFLATLKPASAAGTVSVTKTPRAE